LKTQGTELIAPISIDAEIGNALSAMFKRIRISMDQANKLLSIYNSIPIRREPLRLQNSTDIAFRNGIYAYDAYMLDCAIQFDSHLLSLDKKLIETAKILNVSVLEI